MRHTSHSVRGPQAGTHGKKQGCFRRHGRCRSYDRARERDKERIQGRDTQVDGGGNDDDDGNGGRMGPTRGHGGDGEDPDGDLPNSMPSKETCSTSWNAAVEASKQGPNKRPFRRAMQLSTAQLERMLLKHPVLAGMGSAAASEMVLASSVAGGGGGSQPPVQTNGSEGLPEDRDRKAPGTDRNASRRADPGRSTSVQSTYDVFPKVWGEDRPKKDRKPRSETGWKRWFVHSAVGAVVVGPSLLAWNRWLETLFPGPFFGQQARRMIMDVLVGTPARGCLFRATEGCTEAVLGRDRKSTASDAILPRFSWLNSMEIAGWGGVHLLQPHLRLPAVSVARICVHGLRVRFRTGPDEGRAAGWRRNAQR